MQCTAPAVGYMVYVTGVLCGAQPPAVGYMVHVTGVLCGVQPPANDKLCLVFLQHLAALCCLQVPCRGLYWRYVSNVHDIIFSVVSF